MVQSNVHMEIIRVINIPVVNLSESDSQSCLADYQRMYLLGSNYLVL